MTIQTAIHQPNFFPWLGYFSKIASSDVFIFLDDVQFPKKGGTWINRVQIQSANGPHWFTAPINRQYHGLRTVNEMTFVDGSWRSKLLSQLSEAYHKHPYYKDGLSLVEPILLSPDNNVASFNRNAILALCAALKIKKPKFYVSSQLTTLSTASRRLCELCLEVSSNRYLCGGGSSSYLDPTVFSRYNIDLVYQNFNHPCYPQFSSRQFLPGLSIIDAIMNLGIFKTSQIISN